MKRQSAAERQAKQPSPSKRRWSSKVSEMLGRTLDRHLNQEKSPEEVLDEKFYLNPTIVARFLKAAESLVPLSEVEGLLDEAGVLSLPAHNDNLKKLQELKTLVTILQKDVEPVVAATQSASTKSKATELKLSKCAQLLRRVVSLGVAVQGTTNLVAWVTKHLNCLECLPSNASYERLTAVLAETEKVSKQFDSEVIDLLHKKKDRFKKLLSKSEDILKIPQVCLINEETLHKLLRESQEQGLENAEPILRVRGVVELIQFIRSLADKINGNVSGAMVNELDPTTHEELSDVVQQAILNLKGMLHANTSQGTIDLLITGAAEVRGRVATLGLLDDPDLLNFVAKIESVIWKHKAKLVLSNPEEPEEEFSKLLQSTPSDIVADGCREYSQIKERVHAFQAALQNEKRITEKLETYWQDEQIGSRLPEITAFVRESKAYIFRDKKIERKLDILEQVANAFHNIVGTKNKEELVDELRDLRLENTKVCQKLAGITSTSEKADSHSKYFRKTKSAAQKFRASMSEHLSVKILREVPKIKVSHAREICSFLKGLPTFLKSEYDSDLTQLESDLASLQSLSQEFETQIAKTYTRSKFLEQKLSAEEIKTCANKLSSLVKKVYAADVRDESLEQKITDLDVFVRAASLLTSRVESATKKDFSTWQTTLEALQDIAKDDNKQLLLTSISEKIKSADKIMLEVRKMKQFEGQFNQTTNKAVPLKIITRQNKMPRLDEAKDLLRTYDRECKEIELEGTVGSLRGWIESCEEKLTAAVSPNTQIGDLVTLLDTLKRTPINIETQVAELNDKILRAQDFEKKVKTRTAEQLEYEMAALREEYTKLSVKIPEFERISEQFSAERYRCQTLEESFERLDLSDLMKVRQELMHHKYFRDRTLEVKMLVKLVNMLEEELTRVNSGYDDEIDTPLIDAIALESLNKELNEIKRSSKFSSFANKGGFLSKLVGELKQYLQEKIYVLDLDGLSRLRSKCFKKVVDIRKEITDHKIKLEIAAKSGELKPASVYDQRAEDNRKFDAFGMFGNQPALISRLDRDLAPSTTSHPAGQMDWNQSGFDRRDHPSDLNQMNEERNGKKTKDKLLGALVSSIDREPRKRRPDGTYQDPKKPDMSSGTITRQLRQFFCNGFKYWLERNEHFEITGLDSLMAANTLEKQIYEKYLEKVIEYDSECEAIGKVLRNLTNMKYLSTHIRNRNFRLSIMLKLIDKDKTEIRKIDGFAKTKLDKSRSKPEDGEIKVVEEDDELLENIGDIKSIEEQNLQFSDGGSDVEEELENDQEVPVPPPRFSRAPRALSYDPETGQYQVVKNRFLPGQIQENYMYYSIFKGSAFFETSDKPDPKRKPERARFYSCAEDEFIRYFTEVPDGIQFHPQLTKLEFEQYIQKCLISEVAENYLVLPMWVESSNHLSMKSFYKNNDCVGSIQYSPRCKMFIFPKEYLRGDWFNIINFNIVKRDQNQVELVGFIVLKLTNADTSAYEPPIVPEAVKVDKTHRAFKFIKKGHELVEKPFDIENLKEKPQNADAAEAKDDANTTANPRFLEELVDEHEERGDGLKSSRGGPGGNQAGGNKKKTKLERLMTNDIGGMSVATPAGFEAHSEMFSGDPFGGRITPGPLPGLPVRGGKDSVSTQMLGGMLPKRSGPSANNINDLDSDDDDRLSSPGELEDQMLGKRQQQPFQQVPAGFQQYPLGGQHQMGMSGHQMQSQVPGGHFQGQYGQVQTPAGFSNFATGGMRGGMGGQNPRFQGNQGGGYPAHPSDFNSMNQQGGYRGGFNSRGGQRGGMDRGNRGGFQDGGFNSRGRGGNNMMGGPRGRGGFQSGNPNPMGQAPSGMSGFDMGMMDSGNNPGMQNQMPQAVGFGAGGGKPQQGGYGGQSRGGAPGGFHSQGGFQGNPRGGHDRGGFRGGNDRGGRGSYGGNRGFQGGMGGGRGGFNPSGQMGGSGFHSGGGRGGYNQNQEMSNFGNNNQNYGGGFQQQRGGRPSFGGPNEHMG